MRPLDDLDAIEVVLCDLDGVVWLAHRPIPGSVDAVARIRASGRRVVFVTNNSASTDADVVAALGRVGIAADGDVVTSAMAAASLIEHGERVLVSGGQGIVEAVERRGAVAVPNSSPASLTEPVDAVVAGIDFDFDYQRLNRVAGAVRGGARFVATNTDSTYPTAEGLLPGGGSLIAAIETASGVRAEVAGKPHRPMADVVRSLTGVPASAMLMVGDRLDTDGRFATELGASFALVRTGVTAPDVELGAVDRDDGGLRHVELGAVDRDDGGLRHVDRMLDVADLARLADVVTSAPA